MYPIVFGISKNRTSNKAMLVGPVEKKIEFLDIIVKNVPSTPTTDDCTFYKGFIFNSPSQRFYTIYQSYLNSAGIILIFGEHLNDFLNSAEYVNLQELFKIYPVNPENLLGSTPLEKINSLLSVINHYHKPLVDDERAIFSHVIFSRKSISQINSNACMKHSIRLADYESKGDGDEARNLEKDIPRTPFFLPRAEDKRDYFQTIKAFSKDDYMQGDLFAGSDLVFVKHLLTQDRDELEQFIIFQLLAYRTQSGQNAGLDIAYDPVTKKIAFCAVAKYPQDASCFNDAIVSVFVSDNINLSNGQTLSEAGLNDAAVMKSTFGDMVNHLNEFIDNPLVANHVQAVLNTPSALINHKLSSHVLDTKDDDDNYAPPRSLK